MSPIRAEGPALPWRAHDPVARPVADEAGDLGGTAAAEEGRKRKRPGQQKRQRWQRQRAALEEVECEEAVEASRGEGPEVDASLREAGGRVEKKVDKKAIQSFLKTLPWHVRTFREQPPPALFIEGLGWVGSVLDLMPEQLGPRGIRMIIRPGELASSLGSFNVPARALSCFCHCHVFVKRKPA